jgi:hypothetical protein
MSIYHEVQNIIWQNITISASIDDFQHPRFVFKTDIQTWDHRMQYIVYYVDMKNGIENIKFYISQGHDHMVVGFTTTYAITSYHH